MEFRLSRINCWFLDEFEFQTDELLLPEVNGFTFIHITDHFRAGMMSHTTMTTNTYTGKIITGKNQFQPNIISYENLMKGYIRNVQATSATIDASNTYCDEFSLVSVVCLILSLISMSHSCLIWTR